MPHVRIEDMGHKMGTNGVDNGKLWFDGACLRGEDSHPDTALSLYCLVIPSKQLYPISPSCSHMTLCWELLNLEPAASSVMLDDVCHHTGTRVPRGALLNASSTVDRDGTFRSPVAKPRDRFLKVRNSLLPLTSPCGQLCAAALKCT